MSSINRRELINMLGLSGVMSCFGENSINILEGFLNSFIQKAHADTIGLTQVRNGLLINQHGAPPRWTGFGNMAPQGTSDLEKMIHNWQVNTSIANITTDANGFPVYSYDYKVKPYTFGGKTIYWPELFFTQVAASGGSQRELKELLNNMVSIRGIKMQTEDHNAERKRVFAPVDAGLSITGIAADHSNSYLPYISIGDDYYFKSSKGGGRISVDAGAKLIEELFASLKKQTNPSYVDDGSVESKISNSIAALVQARGGRGGRYENLSDSRKRAEQLLKQSIGQIEGQYTALLDKYNDLINRSLRDTNVPGVTDRKLPAMPKPPFSLDGEGQKLTSLDMKNAFQGTAEHLTVSGIFYCGEDHRDVLKTATIKNGANTFALAELLFKKQYTTMIAGSFDPPGNLDYTELVNILDVKYSSQNGKTEVTSNIRTGAKQRYVNDNHVVGPLGNLLHQTMQTRAFGACMLEFKDQLSSTTYSNGKNAWNETVTLLTAEFGRRPKFNGSDHDLDSNSAIFFGGNLKMDCIGDIQDQGYSRTEAYPGTYGTGVYQDQIQSRIKQGHIASTFLHMLRIDKSPSPNNRSLISMDEASESATPILPTGKTIKA